MPKISELAAGTLTSGTDLVGNVNGVTKRFDQKDNKEELRKILGISTFDTVTELIADTTLPTRQARITKSRQTTLSRPKASATKSRRQTLRITTSPRRAGLSCMSKRR